MIVEKLISMKMNHEQFATLCTKSLVISVEKKQHELTSISTHMSSFMSNDSVSVLHKFAVENMFVILYVINGLISQKLFENMFAKKAV